MHGSSGRKISGTNAPTFDGTQVCAQVDPEMFFPDNPSEWITKLRLVRPLCNSCEFQAPCLEYAVERPELMGIWGGSTQQERYLVRKSRRKKSA